jgi:hypothetical protein
MFCIRNNLKSYSIIFNTFQFDYLIVSYQVSTGKKFAFNCASITAKRKKTLLMNSGGALYPVECLNFEGKPKQVLTFLSSWLMKITQFISLLMIFLHLMP